jgi:glucoamylase
LKRLYIEQWEEWLARERVDLHSVAPDQAASHGDLVRSSLSIIRTHEEKRFEGGIIASLSIPWGQARGDHDLGGYHFVWPRDLAQVGGGLLAAGACEEALRVLHYFQAVQEADGSWSQNLWLDGQPLGDHLQLDQTALPILLLEAGVRAGAVDAVQLRRLRPMVRKAAGFLAVSGPFTRQDRWEEMAGYSTFTIAVQIAALVAAALILDDRAPPRSSDEKNERVASSDGPGERRTGGAGAADLLLDVADDWFDHIDFWTFTTSSELAARIGVAGHYVRLAPQEADSGPGAGGRIDVKNRPEVQTRQAANVVSPDALALVRYGLRRADDPRIVDTLKVIDETLRDEFAQGPCWRRFTGDGYGEHADGSPYDGAGIGRPWPLLTGERAHYELAAGRIDMARRLLKAMAAFAGRAGALPEQVWNADDLPELDLFRGGATHSAKPLVWAHAEYLKLLRSLRDGRIFDQPAGMGDRYLHRDVSPSYVHWSPFHRRSTLFQGRRLRVLTEDARLVKWSVDGGVIVETQSAPAALGFHVAELRTERAEVGGVLRFSVLSTKASENDEEFVMRIHSAASTRGS